MSRPTTPPVPLPRRRRRKPLISFVLLVVVLILWYRYWVPPVVTWVWHTVHGTSVGWRGRSIAVPKGWYARWQGTQPELRHLGVPLAQDSVVTIKPLPTAGNAASDKGYENFRTHAPEMAQQFGFGIQSIRTFVRGGNRAFCLVGFNGAGMNQLCAFTNAGFALFFQGLPSEEADFDTIVRSVLQ